MAQATSGIPGKAGTPDIFSARAHLAANRVLPVVLGLVYGFWAAANRRGGGPITGWNVLFGFVSALAFMVVLMGVQAVAPRLRRELHAMTWGAFAGVAFGFIYSQTGASVLRSVGNSLVVAASVTAVLFYRYYTHEDAAGHRVS
ncbi:hypothetical protein ACKI1I_02430 [Streptomyces turgidiscabies]|uniref:Uncharacterized protein n=1 Tax=Streptomyces turgidiscabies (strain Car8) TaxID=698760 RepID=L7FJG1_STRT8|nr:MULTISPECIES: hypothetical protein [Streptomyces]ELP71314.1 hypothetical protein STRTUCAR8_05438 [Streptomyces turgidiscabies Car8]MDX3492246.1 hypothetical protein [Streptomyces turgidiscabies]GAQ69463.1 hypothetical protein T45_01188 [Streptomyces turgidiscabies]